MGLERSLIVLEWVLCWTFAREEPFEITRLKSVCLEEAQQPHQSVKSHFCYFLSCHIQETEKGFLEIGFANFSIEVDIEGFESILRVEIKVSLPESLPLPPVFDFGDDLILPLETVLDRFTRVVELVVDLFTMMDEIEFGVLYVE